MVFIMFPMKGPSPSGSLSCMVYRTCGPMKLSFALWVHGLESWKPRTEILPYQSHGQEDNQILLCKFYSGTFRAHVCEIRCSDPILFLLRVKAVSIPETDHPFPCISSSTGSASCSCSRHPLSPSSSSSSSSAETFSLLALNKNRSVVSNLLCDDFTIFCQT